MSIDYRNLEPDKVYVTVGGTAVNKHGEIVGWGYDRVKFLRISDNSIVVQTPWSAECTVPLDYPLSETPEEEVFCEFQLIINFTNKIEIPFNEALSCGICKLYNKETNDAFPYNKFYSNLVRYFTIPQTIADAARHFNVPYQRIRHTITSIGNQGYEIIESEIDGKIAIQLKKEN
jgi:hypothetical protein